MIENKNAECLQVAAQHSDNEQSNVHTTIISILSSGLRGLAKLVEEIQSLHGEMTLTRQAQEKQAEQTKRIADSLDRIQGDALTKNEILSELSRDVYGCHSHLAPMDSEVHRIVNGFQDLFPERNFHV